MSFTGIILVFIKYCASVMLLLLSFLAHSIIRFLSKQIVQQSCPLKAHECNDQWNDHSQQRNEQNSSDVENEVFLFNESSFANLFESSKFNTVDIAEVINTNNKDYINLFNNSEKSFKLLGTDEDFFCELTEETLKSLEMSDLNENENQFFDSSPASSPRFNSLFNSLSSMDLELNHIKDTDSSCALESYNFFEDERLINESIIASCALTSGNHVRDLSTTSSSNVSEVASENGRQVSTPIQNKRFRKPVSLRNKLLAKVKISEEFYQQQSPKSKRFLPKKERNRIACKLNKRDRTSSKTSNIKLVEFNTSLLKKMSKNLNLASYKPSTKVEKLLNDTRGMRKYMIDYDGLMVQRQHNFVNLTYSSLVNLTNSNNLTLESSKLLLSNSLKALSNTPRINRLDLLKPHLRASIRNRSVCVNQRDSTANKLSSNRSSSGYLTDC